MASKVSINYGVVKKLPTRLQAPARKILIDPQMNPMCELLMQRRDEFKNPLLPLLIGIAMHPPARRYFNTYLDISYKNSLSEFEFPAQALPEVVVGAGLHAAIYCAVRVATGHKPPVVLEKNRVGGAFACSEGPTFYLNSRNRPGELSLPGDLTGALNYLPGAALQPADISGAEYQTNDDMAWTIRLALAMYGRVYRGDVDEVRRLLDRRGQSQIQVKLANNRLLRTRRLIVATGLTPASTPRLGERIMNFQQLMGHMDKPFPLRGMKKVAVIGAGDSGKTAIEALTGQGPARHASVANLDWPERIDWYGCPQGTREEWEKCQRSRYRGIGRLLPRTTGARARIRPLLATQAGTSHGYESVYVGEQSYDYIIDCRGYQAASLLGVEVSDYDSIDGRTVATTGMGGQIRVIGPASKIPVSDQELSVLGKIGENATSIFRYAGRTAALAASL